MLGRTHEALRIFWPPLASFAARTDIGNQIRLLAMP